MKKIFLIIAAIFAALSIHAQEKQIPKVETTLSDLKAMLELEGYKTFSFDLKTVTGGDKEICNYYAKPFENHPLTESEFHPLVLLGSVWYDSQYDIFRFCGENEIAPDLSSKILKHTPHYFVIGINVKKALAE